MLFSRDEAAKVWASTNSQADASKPIKVWASTNSQTGASVSTCFPSQESYIMSGLLFPTQLGRSSALAKQASLGIVLAATASIVCAGSVRPANAATPLPLGLNAGSVSVLGNNTAWESPSIPRDSHFNWMDSYNSLSAPRRSVLGLLSFGSFGLLAAFRPLNYKMRRP